MNVQEHFVNETSDQLTDGKLDTFEMSAVPDIGETVELGCRRRYAHEASVRMMPMQDPVLTTREVAAQAARVLPDVQVRRLPFWRYELRWQRPATAVAISMKEDAPRGDPSLDGRIERPGRPGR